MAEHSAIEWCDATFNPWWGCEKVSPGCAHCYADTLARRRQPGVDLWGAGHSFRFFGDKHWAEPLKWARTLPTRWGRRPRVFCASMADVFEERPELYEHRERLFDLIDATLDLDWLLLTKRPELVQGMLDDLDRLLPPNVWLGVSIENARFTWRADVLREIPAAVRFISAEPLLGSLFESAVPKPRRLHDWQPILSNTASAVPNPHPAQHCPRCGAYSAFVTLGECPGPPGIDQSRRPLDLSEIDWVIVGGESGPGARPMQLTWAREILEAVDEQRIVHEHDVALFMKQLGAKPTEYVGGLLREKLITLRDRKGGDPDEWPDDLRIREFPYVTVPA